MLKKLAVLIRIAALGSIAAMAASAQNHYIVRLSSNGSITTVVDRVAMQLVASLTGSGSGIFVLNSPLPPVLALPILSAVPGVAAVEVDASVALPEAAKGAALPSTLNQSLSTLGSWIGPYVNQFQIDSYTGASEWSAYVNQPAAGIIGIAAAHQLASGGGTVAVLDTGIDFTHPVLASSTILGWDFVNSIPGGYATPIDLPTSILNQSSPLILNQSTDPILDTDSTVVLAQSTDPILDQSTDPILDGLPTYQPFNEYGHGTMVAGVIHLVAPTASLMPVKVFNVNGGSCISLIIEGIYYAVDHGAKVINMSFSTTQASAELQQAISFANGKGVIVVAAAGNNGQNIMVYPAGYPQVEGVGSTNNQDIRSTFSNYGPVVSVAAPGEGIVTTYPGNLWAAAWGTSFSSPMVAGAAALMVQLNPSIDQAQAAQALTNAAPTAGQQLGAGRLELPQAVTAAAGGH